MVTASSDMRSSASVLTTVVPMAKMCSNDSASDYRQ